MKAVSNGFCVLNTVACAALYATSPVSEGGLGLSRVCVIDIDVHHGTSTNLIKCQFKFPCEITVEFSHFVSPYALAQRERNAGHPLFHVRPKVSLC